MAANNISTNIESVLQEERVFPPPKAFSRRAHLKSLAQYRKLYRESIQSPGEVLEPAGQGGTGLVQALDQGAEMGGAVRQVVRRRPAQCQLTIASTGIWTPPRANKAALIWEGEPAAPGKPGEERTLTYKQLHHEVCRFANVLKRNGIKPGDRVLIYLPMVPEAAIAMLACARIGAVHSVVFGGFSAQSVADRI